MDRRSFVKLTAPLVVISPIIGRKMFDDAYSGKLMTVTGEISTENMGLTLTHEHLFSIFGLDPEEKSNYNVDDLLSTVLPFLEKAKSAGCKTIVECTAAYFGRNAEILKIISEKSGFNILTNTGIYGAANGRYIPQYAYTETAEQVASRWIAEWNNGIGRTGIRPGFMKLGFNNGQLTAIDKKLLHAAAITHLASGLTIAAHTANNPEGAFEQLDILRINKLSPSAWIWTHAHDVPSNEPLLNAAGMGAWISFDGYRNEKHERFLQGLQGFKKAGYLDHVLLSHDGNGYPQRGKIPSRLTIDLLTNFLPALISSGFSESEIHQMTVVNPSKAFAVRVRKL